MPRLNPSCIAHAGYLWKSPPLKKWNLLAKWNCRWFVLYDNFSDVHGDEGRQELELIYFENADTQRNGGNSIGIINIMEVEVEVEISNPKKGFPFVLRIVTKERLWFLCTNKFDDFSDWINTLKERTVFFFKEDSSSSPPDTERKEPIHEIPNQRNLDDPLDITITRPNHDKKNKKNRQCGSLVPSSTNGCSGYNTASDYQASSSQNSCSSSIRLESSDTTNLPKIQENDDTGYETDSDTSSSDTYITMEGVYPDNTVQDYFDKTDEQTHHQNEGGNFAEEIFQELAKKLEMEKNNITKRNTNLGETHLGETNLGETNLGEVTWV